MNARPPSLALRLGALAGLLFLYVPILIIVLYAFTTEDRTYRFPPPGLTLEWFPRAAARTDMWAALWLSVRVAFASTLVAAVLGTLVSLAMARARFPMRDAVTLLMILPIALPGIVTGIALLTSFRRLGLDLSTFTIVVGHATFCVVTVYNNVVARLRRTSVSLVEASMDLGADYFQTLRHVLLPGVATALLAGMLLSFALSLDEVIVTTFTAGQQQTLPIWFLGELFRPRERPVTNVVALMVIALTLVPILLSVRLTSGTDDLHGGSRSA
ncbi:ABC transporter permease [Deinococcus pimensis]|uniref:ABC transporter permease n=1 Tax=Deinococcus pimensis TaxID=309888 RepID=UPI000485C145|nr:ABC transporter permease [Deinococcus pimensis]